MSYEILKRDLESKSQILFEATTSIFKNGIVINHQKVGTRFLQVISSGDSYSSNNDNKQVMFQISSTNSIGETKLRPLKYLLTTNYVYAPWSDDSKPWLTDTYPIWKSDDIFLKENGCETYTDFFFNNKKDIYIIIRNPIDRFFSGIIQTIGWDEFGHKEVTAEKFQETIKNNWKDLMSDIHTMNYLKNFKEFIYHVNDKSKLHIIDLSHLKSKKACEFFCELREDDIIRKIYADLDNNIDSNKKDYEKFYDLFNMDNIDTFTILDYLKPEYQNYMDLRYSKFFKSLI